MIHSLKKNCCFGLVFLLFLTTVGCDMQTRYTTIETEELYKIDVADYLSSTDRLNENASLQYQNDYKEVYLIVIDEKKNILNKKQKLSGYFDTALSNVVSGNLKNLKQTKPASKKINGLDALQSEIEGTVSVETQKSGKKVKEEVAVYYKLCVLESESGFYQVFCWTLAGNKKKYGVDMQKMIDSFAELPGAAQKRNEKEKENKSN